MSAQVSLETQLTHLCTTLDGAWHHMAVVHAGTLGLTTSRHGSEDRWDWGVTALSLQQAFARAQVEEMRRQQLLDRAVREQRMTRGEALRLMTAKGVP